MIILNVYIVYLVKTCISKYHFYIMGGKVFRLANILSFICSLSKVQNSVITPVFNLCILICIQFETVLQNDCVLLILCFILFVYEIKGHLIKSGLLNVKYNA